MPARVACLLVLVLLANGVAAGREPVPEKLVVLTFDDSVRSHFTVVRPILLDYKFGATFFITEGFEFRENKEDYMTWDQIAELSRDGFEIGNHTGDHKPITAKTIAGLDEQLTVIERECCRHGIPRPVSFAYPGNATLPASLPILRRHGIRFARRGGMPEHPYKTGRGVAWEPGLDHPLLVPSAGDARPGWELADFRQAVERARHGRIAVLQFHGVPDRAHPWVHTRPEQFQAFMKYLSLEGYTVISLRDAARYVDPALEPRNPDEVVEDRKRTLAAKRSRDNFRRPANAASSRSWLKNMLVFHRFAVPEVCAATGLTRVEVKRSIQEFGLDPLPKRPRPGKRLQVLPYPGGRHPRIGFRDGAMRPQRETKVSVFLPWEDAGYVVVDVPEAIWVKRQGARELLYLAHTHVPTMWTRLGVELKPLEWQTSDDGVLQVERLLPNRVAFGARMVPGDGMLLMELWIRNGTDETLTGLTVQNCVMLKSATGFNRQANDNKRLSRPYVACRNMSSNRWIITAWTRCQRSWANQHCPCMHSDPRFPDCEPGVTQRLRGWLSFYEGTDIEGELKRIERTGWHRPVTGNP